MTAFPFARSVTPVEGGTDGKFAQKVLETDPRSWAETDLKGLFTTSKPEQGPGQGRQGRPDRARSARFRPRLRHAPAPATPPRA